MESWSVESAPPLVYLLYSIYSYQWDLRQCTTSNLSTRPVSNTTCLLVNSTDIRVSRSNCFHTAHYSCCNHSSSLYWPWPYLSRGGWIYICHQEHNTGNKPTNTANRMKMCLTWLTSGPSTLAAFFCCCLSIQQVSKPRFSIIHLKCISFSFNPVIQNMCSNDPKRAFADLCLLPTVLGIVKWVQSHQTHGACSTVML